jgi:hypothetical protein
VSEVKEVEDAFRKEHTQSIADNNACAAVPVLRECGAARKRINKRDGETELKSIKWGCFGRYELWNIFVFGRGVIAVSWPCLGNGDI